jgi:putative transposase
MSEKKGSNHRYPIYNYSKEAEGPFAVLAVSSYIHRNPIDTKKPMVEQLIDYPYSSFPMYCSEDPAPKAWIDLEFLPTLLPVGIDSSRHNYSLYCQLYRQATEEDKKLNLLLSDDAWL